MIIRFCKKHSLQLSIILELIVLFVLGWLSPDYGWAIINVRKLSVFTLVIWEIIILALTFGIVFMINFFQKSSSYQGHHVLVKIPHTKHDYHILTGKLAKARIGKECLPEAIIFAMANLLATVSTWVFTFHDLYVGSYVLLFLISCYALYKECYKLMHTRDIAFKGHKVIVSTYGDKHPTTLRITYSNLHERAEKQRKQHDN